MRNSLEVSESSSVPTGHPLKQSLLASFASPRIYIRGQLVFFKAVVHSEQSGCWKKFQCGEGTQ